jgi:hypothetical protein
MTSEPRKVASKFAIMADEWDRYEDQIKDDIEADVRRRLEAEVEAHIEKGDYVRVGNLHHERTRVQIGEDHVGAFEMIEWRLWTVAEPKETP